MSIEVSEDQNTVIVDDVVYATLPQQRPCAGCAFDRGDECGAPTAPCRASWRKDERSVIFIRSDVQPAPKPIAALVTVPALTVTVEPGYMSRGHYHPGSKAYIDPTQIWRLPIGTKLYTGEQLAAAVNDERAMLAVRGA